MARATTLRRTIHSPVLSLGLGLLWRGLVAASLLLPLVAGAEVTSGRATGVTDGDTIALLVYANGQPEEVKVRLSGIDAPERSQPFGRAAKQRLSDLLFGRDVTVEWFKRDRYERLLGKVMLDGADMNLEMVRSGHAWVFTKYLNEIPPVDREAYVAAEQEARTERRGLWTDPAPVPPWEWRKRR